LRLVEFVALRWRWRESKKATFRILDFRFWIFDFGFSIFILDFHFGFWNAG
jgi:hypothetical protein